MTIGVVATLKIQPGKESEFEAVFGALQEQVRANEPGCLMYDLFKSKAEEATYVVMEKYESEDALKAHGKTEYFRAAGPKLGGVLGGAPKVEYFTRVS
jgi:quinol monooxygenase YgiN